MPQFVILTHDFPVWHWDFMLEQKSALQTWRLLANPASGEGVGAELLADHRSEYLDYEGPVSGNRGNVQRWDRGEYQVLEDLPDRLVVRLNGTRLAGRATLLKTTAKEADRTAPALWTFQFTPEAAGTSEPGN